MLTDPHQAVNTHVDLIDEGQAGLPEFPLNLVDSDRLDAGSLAANNPTRYVDPDGRRIDDFIEGAANGWSSSNPGKWGPAPLRKRAAAQGRKQTKRSSHVVATITSAMRLHWSGNGVGPESFFSVPSRQSIVATECGSASRPVPPAT